MKDSPYNDSWKTNCYYEGSLFFWEGKWAERSILKGNRVHEDDIVSDLQFDISDEKKSP